MKERVLKANIHLVEAGLVKLTWGNASAVDREKGVVFIKPSGVDYENMTADDMVEVDLESGQYSGKLRPSSDTPTHLYLYRAFPQLGGIVHTHSRWATSWAQAFREIPCLGTTHADHFYGSVPLTRFLTKEEIDGEYELNTGVVIAERFAHEDPEQLPGVLVAGHGPFTWGATVEEAVKHSIILEEIAMMAYHTFQLGKKTPVHQALLDKHYSRKHGPGKYYGQQF